MAKMVIYKRPKSNKLTLIEFLERTIDGAEWSNNGWHHIWELSLKGHIYDGFVICRHGLNVAFIYEVEPYTIALFNKSAQADIEKMIKSFKSKAIILLVV